MSTRIEITLHPTTVELTVVDDTGRNERAIVPRHPDPRGAKYVEMIDALDYVMYAFKSE